MTAAKAGRTPHATSKFGALVAVALRRELRTKDALQAGLVLVATFLVLGILTFSTLADEPRAAAYLLWVPLVYAGLAAAGRALAADTDRGTLDLLRTLPVQLAWHGHARTVANLPLLTLVAAIVAAAASALFALEASVPLAVALLLGAVGLALVGTLAGALAAQARSRETLLPILAVPVLAPLLHAGVDATIVALAGGTLEAARPALLLMVAYDVAAFGAAWILWPVVLEGD